MWCGIRFSYDVPDVFSSVTELAASHTCRQAVIGNGDRVVLEFVGEVIAALCHGTNEDAYALLGTKSLDVVAAAYDLGLKR
jgi:hypothetical protein